MFRPSASSTYSSAVSAMRTQKLPAACSISGRIASARAPSTHSTVLFGLLIVMAARPSGAVLDAFAQQAGRPQREHHDQDDESEDVRVVASQYTPGQGAEVAGTDRLDQPQQDAADHRAGQVADAAEPRRRERLQPGKEAHGVLHGAVVRGVH